MPKTSGTAPGQNTVRQRIRLVVTSASVPGNSSVPQIANVYAACHDVTDISVVKVPYPRVVGKMFFDN
ncbi:MAG TPA: hypothetical protein VNV88_15560 [Candidatus Solibacter sp.]|nr:hypothetical protein [Candidatus Solibacter sp.]